MKRVSAFGLAALASAMTVAQDADWHLDAVGANGDAGVVLARLSPDGIPDESGRETVHPALELYCTPGDPDGVGVRVDWRRFISSFNTEVGFRIDDGKRSWLKLGVDASNRVTVAKAGADTAKLLALFDTGSSLSVEVAPYSEPPVTVGFDLTGLAGALDDLRNACN